MVKRTIWGWMINATPRPLYPRERPSTRIRGWVGPRAGLDGLGNLTSTGFDPQTFQPVASRHTDWAVHQNLANLKHDSCLANCEVHWHSFVTHCAVARGLYSIVPCTGRRLCADVSCMVTTATLNQNVCCVREKDRDKWRVGTWVGFV